MNRQARPKEARQLELFPEIRPMGPLARQRKDPAEILDLFRRINRRYFDGDLREPRILLSARLKRAGMVYLDRRELVLSIPYHDRYGWGRELIGTLKHEMIHMWLAHLRRPAGHTRAFHELCRAISAPRYCRPFSRPYRYLYTCPRGHDVKARRKLPNSSCARCDARYNHRYRLTLRRALR